MIKIKLSDNKNIKCFGGILLSKDILSDYSMEITDSNDYDYEFVTANEFLDLSLPFMAENKVLPICMVSTDLFVISLITPCVACFKDTSFFILPISFILTIEPRRT